MSKAAGRDEVGTQSVIDMALPGLPLGQCLLIRYVFLDISFPPEIQTFIVYIITGGENDFFKGIKSKLNSTELHT